MNLPAAELLPDQSATRESPWVRWLFAVAVLLTCGRIMAMNQTDPDLWGHAQYGRDLLREGTLPETATWTYTSVGFPWVNHELIAEITTAWALDQWGTVGLTVGKYLISLFIIGLIYWNGRRRGVQSWLMGFICLVSALAMEFHWHFRPQVLGYLFFAMEILLLSWCFEDWRPATPKERFRTSRLHWLFLLLPLMTLWANSHGSIAAGVGVAIAMLALRSLEVLVFKVQHRTVDEAAPAATGWGTHALLLALGLGVIGAALVNPYWFGMYRWMWEALSVPRPEIQDWGWLPFWTASRESLCCWIILLTFGLAVWQSRNRDWPNIIIFLLIAWESIRHIRHLPMLAMMWGFCFALPLEELRRTLSRQLQAHSTADAAPATVSSGRQNVLTILLILWILAAAVLTWPRLAHIEVPRETYPVDAFRFLTERQLAGRTIVTFNWAQYAIGLFAATGLDSTVSFDGRLHTCYSHEEQDRHFDFIFGADYTGPRNRSPLSGPIDPTETLTTGDPEIVIVSRRQQPSVRTMESQTESWVKLYEDPLAQIWGRRDLFDEPSSPRYLPPDQRVMTDEPLEGWVSYPAFPVSLPAED
ncbi:hypothetical protein [Planctomicrobium sp. SH664]|uniref:hypothetical protein n=1 Tax=Planctomicrobium sp. SH664 TaxID=3448125 RepID=UPI003F5BA976